MSKILFFVKLLSFRIWGFFALGAWAFMNPRLMNMSNFKCISDLMMLIMKVATENRHMMCELAIVHMEEQPQPIVTIWAGAGIDSSPTKRIGELLKENELLHEEINKLLSQQHEPKAD